MTVRRPLIAYMLHFEFGFGERLHRWRQWKLDSKLHSIADIPAIQWPVVSCSWFRHGKLHRAGGRPAVIYTHNSCDYYLHGIPCSKAISAKHKEDC